jgi:archaellin
MERDFVKTTNKIELSKRLWKIFAAIGIIALISMMTISAVNLENNSQNTGNNGTVNGTVFHGITGQPLPGTKVMLSYHDEVKSTEADGNGNFRFTNIPICYCLKNLSAYRTDFDDWFKLISVDENTFENIFLEPENGGNGKGEIELSTDKSTYELGENVTIYMTNIGDATLEHPNGYGDAVILDIDGNPIFSGWAVDTGNSSLHPGQKVMVAIWDQHDYENKQVQTGTYVIKKEYGGATDTMEFTIGKSNGKKSIDVTTDKLTYSVGEDVTIYMTNSGDLTLEHSSGWDDFKVIDMDGNLVFHQDCVTDALTSLLPGETVLIGVWNQQDGQENRVEPGSYTIKKEYGGATDSTTFTITGDDVQKTIEVTTDQPAYGLGDCITINITNTGDETLYHPNGWGGYKIENRDGKVVYEIEVNIEMVTSLSPKETITIGTWEQVDNSGNQVQPGTYTLIKEYGGVTDTTEFEIRNYFVPIKGDIIGIIFDAKTNDPLPDTKITLEFHDLIFTTMSDSNGQFNFKDVPICFCLKILTASKNGYVVQEQEVAVHEITFVNFTLEPEQTGKDPNDPDLKETNDIIRGKTGADSEYIIKGIYYFLLAGFGAVIVFLILFFVLYKLPKIKKGSR